MSFFGEKKTILEYFAVILIIAALYTTLSWLTPVLADDWAFMSHWRDITGGEYFSWRNLLLFTEEIRRVDNGRIPNIVDPIFVMFPPWKQLFPFITGAFMAYCIHAVGTMVRQGAPGGRIFLLSCIWLAFICLLPLRFPMFVADYSLNYIWSAGITLLCIIFMARHETRGWTLRSKALAALLVIVAGGWHETFAISTIAGFALWIATRRLRASRTLYTLLLLYLVSAIIFFTSQGMTHRLSAILTGEEGPGCPPLRPMFFLPVIISAVALVAIYLSAKGKRLLSACLGNPFFVISLGAMAASFAIALVASREPRSFFFPDICGLVIMFILLKEGGWMPRRKMIRGILAALFLAVCILQSAGTIVWQHRYLKEYDEIMSLLKESPSGTVFYDVMQPDRLPRYTLGIPARETWTNMYYYRNLWSYFETPVLSVVPSRLADIDFGSGQPLGGDAGVRRINDCLVGPMRVRPEEPHLLVPRYYAVEITDSEGAARRAVVLEMPFVTQGDSPDTLMYLRPEEFDPGSVMSLKFAEVD